jgi:hypothetical protein
VASRCSALAVVGLFALGTAGAQPTAPTVSAAPIERTAFDHLTTGFELIGKHRDLPCESCHVNAIFKGTPRDCASCHGVGTQVRATKKPTSHILTSNRCEGCHTPVAFSPAVNFDHAEVQGSCSSCHNNVQAQGKGPTHIDTNLECNACHSTIGWAGAVFTHDGITTGCARCHDNLQAKGTPPTHILPPTGGAPCEACHIPTQYTSFAGATMNHPAIGTPPMLCTVCHEAGMSFFGVAIVTRPPAPHATTGDCYTCHTSFTTFKGGTGQPVGHIPTSQPCVLCHSNPADYSIYVMKHDGISSGCATCHAAGLSFTNMAPPTLVQPPANHIAFGSAACESCHSNTNFTTPGGFIFANASGTTPPAMVHSAVSSARCDSCHASGLTFAGAPPTKVFPANHVPIGGADCGVCHGNSSFSTFMFTNASGTAAPAMVHSAVSSIACSTCHEKGLSWAGVPATKLRPATEASGAAHPTSGECSDCHKSTVTFVGAGNYPANHIPLPNGASTNCSSCHADPNNYATYAMDHGVVPGTACSVCHGAGKSFANMAPPTLKLPPSNHIPFGTATCESCHAATNFTSFVIGNVVPPMNHAAVSSLACAACHGAGLSFVGAPAVKVFPATGHIPTGSTACQNCHSATNFTSFVITNAVPPMNHAGFTTGCVNCHATGKTFLGAPPTVTMRSTHIPTGTIACEKCHSNSNFGTFVMSNASGTAPPSMVHTAVTSIACSACHEAGKTWDGTPATKVRPALKADGTAHAPAGECSTCHFSTTSFKGASDLPANHIPLPAADNNNCALCHTTPGNYSIGVMNHVNITSNCTQCHGAGKSFANMAPPTLKVPPGNHIPFGTAACESCHSATNFTNFVIGNKVPPMSHAAVASISCNSCHGAGLTFVGTPAVKVFPATGHIPTGTTSCTNCHSATNFTSFVITNTVPPMSHTGFTTGCVNCHGAGKTFLGTPATKVLPANHIPTGTIACEGCHSKTDFSTFVIPNASGTAPPSMVHTVVTSIVCSACHEAGKTFVGTPAVKVRPAKKADGTAHVAAGECSTCHFNTTSFKGAADLPANHIPLPAADANNCSLCHTTAGNYSLAVMNHVNISTNCAQCHAYGLSFANMAPPTLKAPPSGPTGHIPSNPPNGTSSIACEQCHKATVFTTFSGTIMKHAAVRSMTCMSCHEIGMQWKTNTGVRLWVRDGANHHKGQDCGGSGCHSTRDKFGARRGVAASASQKSGTATPALGAGSALGRTAGFNHRRVAGTACTSCHGPTSGLGKPTAHIATSDNCESCHGTLAWLPVTRVDHTQVRGSCAGCHNSTVARGKGSNHIASDNSCATCHTTNAWTPARFDHSAVAAHTCVSCHDGLHATGLPVNHVPTSAQCDTCHGTLGWKPAKLDHTTLLSNCAKCHNNTIALGVTATHMSTQRDCATCHAYADWTALHFVHVSGAYPGEHRAALSCASCHTSNSDQIPWPAAAEAGSCAGCHAAVFKPDLHPKTTAGLKYTVAELRDCTGACHVYSDATLGTVVKSVPGNYHRVSDAAFKH